MYYQRLRGNPSSLIEAHSLTHDVSLRKGSNESEDRDKESSSSKSPILPIVICLFHVGFFSAVGMFLAQRFLDNRDRLLLGLFLLALVAMSAALFV